MSGYGGSEYHFGSRLMLVKFKFRDDPVYDFNICHAHSFVVDVSVVDISMLYLLCSCSVVCCCHGLQPYIIYTRLLALKVASLRIPHNSKISSVVQVGVEFLEEQLQLTHEKAAPQTQKSTH